MTILYATKKIESYDLTKWLNSHVADVIISFVVIIIVDTKYFLL